jgi:hypothetical protein
MPSSHSHCALQVSPIPANWRSQLNTLKEGSPLDISSCLEFGSIDRFKLLDLVSNKGKNPVYTSIIDAYLEMLCSYGNKRIELIKYDKINKSNFFYTTDMSFYNLLNTSESTSSAIASRTLSKLGLQSADLFHAYILFLPIDIPIGGPDGHACLLIISPYRKSMHLYDS